MTVAELKAMADDVARRFGLDPKLLHALVTVESSWRPDAVSPDGAIGLTQVLPSTAQGAARVGELDGIIDLPEDLSVSEWRGILLDPLANLTIGGAYLLAQLRRFGDVRVALAAYNGGPTRVARLIRENRTDGDAWRVLERLLPPETRVYVARVLTELGPGDFVILAALGSTAVFLVALAAWKRATRR